jgi:hypothetical protein
LSAPAKVVVAHQFQWYQTRAIPCFLPMQQGIAWATARAHLLTTIGEFKSLAPNLAERPVWQTILSVEPQK